MKTEMVSKIGLSFVVSILMLSSMAFAQGFQDVIGTLKDIGVFQFYLPFLIVFGIFYGLLSKTKLFGDQKIFPLIISLGAAGFILIYTPLGITFSQFLTNFVGGTVTVILTLVVIVMFVSILGSGGIFKLPEKGFPVYLVLGLILLVVLGVFIASGGTSIFPGLKIGTRELFGGVGGLSSTTLALIILVIGTGAIIYFFGRGKIE